jgi:hypothetical protein
MANKSERRRKEQAKKKAAKEAAMQQPGFRSRYAQRRLRAPILGQQRPKMRHGEGFAAQGPGGHLIARDFWDASAVVACLQDRFGGWATALGAAA